MATVSVPNVNNTPC